MGMRSLLKGWSMPLGLLLFALLVSGCAAGKGAFVEGGKALQRENYDQAVTSFLTAIDKEPGNQQYRLQLRLARAKAALAHKTRGDQFLEQQSYGEALEEYQLAVALDGSLYTAADGLVQARRYLQAETLVEEAEGLLNAHRHTQADDVVKKALTAVPGYPPALRLQEKIKNLQYTVIDGVELEVDSSQLLNLNFREAELPDVFAIITKLSGINFILDEDVRSNNTTLFLERATFSQALELLLRMNKLDKKILNRKTIILFPKTRNKQKQFEDQIIQTFFLSSIDAKKAVNLLRTMLKVRRIYVHEELNAIILRDEPAVVKLAQKIIETNDRGNSEVVFDLELIEVNHSDIRELGLKLSNYSVGAGFGQPTSVTAGEVTSVQPTIVSSGLSAGQSAGGLIAGIDGFRNLDSFYAIPTATFRLLKTQTDVEILASPKIRVKNQEKARVHVGSREPTITVTINNDQTSENVQYVDVGVKLNVEPRIQLDGSIVTKLGLEVSNVSDRQTTATGTAVLTISTTNADTVLSLKDGEQTIIGGLIRDDNSTTKNKIPLLGDIPLLGELFSGTDKTKTKREILLSITPHIVKRVNLPQGTEASIWSGGEDDLKDGRNFGSFAAEYAAGQQGLQTQADFEPEAEKESFEAAAAVQPAVVASAAEDAGAVPGKAGRPSAATGAVEQSASATETAPPGAPTTLPQARVAEVSMPQGRQPSAVVSPRVYAQSPQLVRLDEVFTVTFFVNEIKNLFSAPLYVKYDTRLFEFIGAAEGSFFKQGGGSTIFTHTALSGGGRIIVGFKQGAGGNGVTGDGDLFSMQFKALAEGGAEISPARTNFRTAFGERLHVDTAGVRIEVSN